MVRSSVRGSIVGLAVGLTLASGAQAIPVRRPECRAWVDEPSISPFVADVPVEGKVLLPFVLVEGAVADSAGGSLGDPVISAQVYDQGGQSLPGYIVLVDESLGAGTSGTHAEWLSSRQLVPGARYRMDIDAQNFPECQPYAHLMATYDFKVAEKTLAERSADALPEVESVGLDWTRAALRPECCVARDTEHCADPARCFACTNSAVRLNVVVPVAAEPESAYLLTELLVRAGPPTNIPTPVKLAAGATEARSVVSLCETEYCAAWRVTSPLTGTSVESEERCVPGAEPTIEPEENGAELIIGDPCAVNGNGTASFHSVAPPGCLLYPEVRWFGDAVEGLVALGLDQTAAEAQARADGTGARAGTGGTSGGVGAASGGTGGMTLGSPGDGSGTTSTHRAPHCGFTTREVPRATGSPLAWLGAALLVFRRQRRRRASARRYPACPPRPPCPPSSPSPPIPDDAPAMPLPA